MNCENCFALSQAHVAPRAGARTTDLDPRSSLHLSRSIPPSIRSYLPTVRVRLLARHAVCRPDRSPQPSQTRFTASRISSSRRPFSPDRRLDGRATESTESTSAPAEEGEREAQGIDYGKAWKCATRSSNRSRGQGSRRAREEEGQSRRESEHSVHDLQVRTRRASLFPAPDPLRKNKVS